MDLISNRPRQACRSKVLTQICLLTLVVALLFGHVDKVSAQGEAPPTTTVESFQNGTEAITEAKTTFTGTTLAATDASSSYTSPSDTSPSDTAPLPTNFDPTSSATFSEISNIIPQESLSSSTPTFQTSVLSLADTPSNVDSSTPAGASPGPQENLSIDSSSNGVTSSILESSQGADASSTMNDSPSQTIASSVQPTETVQQSSEFQTPSLSTNAVEALTTPVAFQTSEMPSAPVYTGQESDWSDSPVQDTIKASDWSASPTQDTNTASDWSVSLTQDTIKASDWSESFQDSSLPATIQSSSTEFVFPTSASNNFPPSSVSSTELLTTLDLSSSVLEPGPLTLSDVTLTEMHPTSVVSDSSSSQVVLSEYSSEAKLDSSTVVPNMDASSQVISPTPLQSDSSDVTQLVPSQSMESVSESWTTSPQASSLTETLPSLSNESMAATVTENSSLTYTTDAFLSTNVSVTMSMLETAADFNTTSTLYIADSGMSTFLWSSYLTLNENLTSSTPFFTELSSESQMSISSQDLSEIYYSTNETYSTSIITDSLSQFVSKTDISVSTISWYFNETSTSMIDTESLITANYSDYFTSDLMPTFTSTINVTESFASMNTSDMPGFSYSSVDVNSSAIFLPITPSAFSDFTTLSSSFIASENVSSYSYYTANETSLISSSPSIELSELSTGINATEVPLLSTMSGSEVSQLSTYVSEMATTISNITEMLSSVSTTTAVDTSSIVYNSSDITPTPPLLSSFTLSSMESSSLLSSLEYTASSQNESASTIPVSSTSQYSSVFYTPSPLPTDSFVMESSNSSSGIIILPTPSSSQSSVSMSSSGSPTVTIMTTSVEVSSAFPNVTSSAITPSTPTTQKPGTTVPTIVNSQNMTEFWVITRFKVRTNVDVSSQQFKSSIEKGLANSYHVASIRSEEIKNGTYVPLVRKRREATATDNPNIKVQVVSATRQESTSAVDVVYVVEQNGQLVPATKAAEQMKLLTEQEVAIQTGQVVSLTAQPYITPASSGEDNTKWIILGCVLGGALLIAVIIIIVCCCCCGNRCCRKDEDEKTTKFQDARLVKVTKRNTDHDEYVDDDPSKNGKMSFTSRKAKYAVSQDSDMEDPLYSDARKEPTKVPRKTRSSLQPSESQEMRVENERKGRADTPQRSRRKKNRDMETEHDIRSVYASQMASLQTGDATMYSQEEFTLNAHPTVEEEGDLLENAEEERRKNKQRLRAKKLRENGLPSETDDATLAAYEKAQKELDKVLGPRSKADEDTFKKQKGKGKKKKDGKKGEDNEGYEENEKPEETLEEARQRMHKLLDDAFSLISHSKSSIGNKVQPSNEDEKNTSQPIISREDHGVQASFDAHPNEGPKHTPLRVIRTHEPYDSSGLVTWSPYRASDEIATISLPHTQTNLNTSPPQQEKLNTSTFTESMPSTARTNYYATQPGEPIVIRSKNLETSLPPNGSHHRKSSNSQNQTKHSETFQNPMYENTLPLRSLDRYSDPYDGLSSLQDLPVSHLTEPNRKSGDALIDIRAHTAPQRGEKKDYDEMDVIKGSIQPGASPQPLINSLREELQTLSNKRMSTGSNGGHTKGNMAESVPLKTNGTTLKDIASNRKTSGL